MQLLTAGRETVWTEDEEALRKRARIYQPQALQSVWLYLARQLGKPR
jgi:hypothetical protein